MSATACIICKKPVRPRAENGAFPFCSERCRQVDLGKWLNEEYRLPAEEADDDLEGLEAVAARDADDTDEGKN
jgi:endogenous inhibitor of DNA gyrase (YacG/DUF329 family)